MSNYNSQNNTSNTLRSKQNWELHKKLQKNYNKYLTENQINIKLKGNSNFNNMPITYYLNNNKEPITNDNLTPLPIREKKFLKKSEKIKEYSNMQRSVVHMRRIEYNNKIIKNHKKINYNEIYYKIPLIIEIQRIWKKRFERITKKAEKIQAKFKQYIYRKYYLISRELKLKIDKFIFIIQKVLFFNFSKIKILKLNKDYCFITKTKGRFDEIKLIQNYIRNYLITKNCKRVYNKQKCVFIRPIQDLQLNKIKQIQFGMIKSLQIIRGRKKKLNSFTALKKTIPLSKIITIQRFIKGIYKKKIKPNISKQGYDRNYYFTKIINIENEEHKKEVMKSKMKYNTRVIPFREISLKFLITSKRCFITKTHKKTEKIILIQKHIKKFLNNIGKEYEYIDIPKNHEYITKYDMVMFEQKKLIYLQRKIKFFLYRKKVRKNAFNKVLIEPQILTKSIRTSTEKIFQRLSKLRIEYDKNLITMIVRIIENTRKACARPWFYKLKNSKRRKLKMIIKKVKKNDDDIIINPLSLIKKCTKLHPILQSINIRVKPKRKNFSLPSSDLFRSLIFNKNNNENKKNSEEEDKNEEDERTEEENNLTILKKLRSSNRGKTLKKKMTVIKEESSDTSSLNSQILNNERKETPKNYHKTFIEKSKISLFDNFNNDKNQNQLLDNLNEHKKNIERRRREINKTYIRKKSSSVVEMRDTEFLNDEFS